MSTCAEKPRRHNDEIEQVIGPPDPLWTKGGCRRRRVGRALSSGRRAAFPLLIVTLTVVACSAQTGTTAPRKTPLSTTTVDLAPTSTLTTVANTPVHALGEFPEVPADPLPESTANGLQSVIDEAVAEGTFTGVAAAVILADQGIWTGAAGSWDGVVLGPEAAHPTHSSGKTFVAAETLRLVEEGLVRLDDPVSDFLPPELAFYDTNGATVRQLLAMRSGIPSLNGDVSYPAEQADSVVEVFEQLPDPSVPAGTVTEYASTNFVLLGAIIQNVTGRSLSDVIRSDVLGHPGLEGIVYNVDDALASDGYGVEAPAASLARWGYDLYGGFVISPASLGDMTNFEGEWYGLGVMDFSSEYNSFSIGHQGLSSPATCCSAIILVAFPEEGLVVSVQANTTDTTSSNSDVDRLAGKLRSAIQG